ncbi:hypothetical protein L6164_033237 [Bauhinia variegata]|uniref:Uncharacterized protein n=1 Tax=Bauhinia variegata TaxID=167791 RepID=A0ACB9KR77_BAUVA|nr:hypothetical protein L6164_033237 [Bauhinia variegata]
MAAMVIGTGLERDKKFFSSCTPLFLDLYCRPPFSFVSLRFLSFASPEEAAAERHRRKRQLRIEPPLSALNRCQPQQAKPQSQSPPYYLNPNNPKLPEHVSALTVTKYDKRA